MLGDGPEQTSIIRHNDKFTDDHTQAKGFHTILARMINLDE